MRRRIATVAGDSSLESHLAAELARQPDIELVLRCMERAEALAVIRSGHLDALVLAGVPAWFDRQVADEAASGGVRAFIVDDHDTGIAARFGIRLVPPGDVTAVLDSLDGLEPESYSDRDSGDTAERTGCVTAVWGPKGAPGRTTIAIELSFLLAARGQSALLIDGDPYGGDVIQMLGLVEELPSVVWGSRMAAKGELDEAAVIHELRTLGRGGPAVLSGLPRAEMWGDVDDYGWQRLLEESRRLFDHTVVDVGFCVEPQAIPYGRPGDGRNHMTRTTLGVADHVVLVCRATAVGLRRLVVEFDSIAQLVPADRMVLVVNHADRRQRPDVENLLRLNTGLGAGAFLPELSGPFTKALARGRALAELDGRAIAGHLTPVVKTLTGRAS